ncbi:MAG TPA: hypothetical protein VF510_21530 [Ktedonobacterales bacterium]
MAWVLVTGEDAVLYQNVLRVVRPSGYDVIAAPDGAIALQLLVDSAHEMIVLLRLQMGQMDAADFLATVEADSSSRLRWRHAYILLHGEPGNLPIEVEQRVARLGVWVVASPGDTTDVEDWADLLDTLALAARQLPSSRLSSSGGGPKSS